MYNPDLTIVIAGYPKSGNVHLTNLVGDSLNASTHASLYSSDKTDIAAKKRSGKYHVRRGHFNLDRSLTNRKTPFHKEHTILTRVLTKERVLFVVRDPRDIAISARHYFTGGKESNISVMNRMVTGKKFFNGSWINYIQDWCEFSKEYPVCFVLYEDLLLNPVKTLRSVFNKISVDCDMSEIECAVDVNRIENKRKEVMREPNTRNKSIKLKHIRKGVSGQWKTDFSDRDKDFAIKMFGEWLVFFGYEGADD